MAMLAEPRRNRKRYNLVPRGKALYEDDNRFGTKMLEKMGWSKGKGLGSKEDGAQEFVRIKYKNDANGLGFEDRDDQWTEHEKLFNGLLTSLNNSENNSESDDEEELPSRMGFGFSEPPAIKKESNKNKDKISGESLEEKSKNSKARVHYKKFTKGKDLSQYSEKDLANIFGKKPTDDSSFQQFEEYLTPKEDDSPLDDKDEKNFGITTINTGTSVNDYFKEKLKKKRSQTNLSETRNVPTTENEVLKDEIKIEIDHQDIEANSSNSKKKTKKSKKHVSSDDTNNIDLNDSVKKIKEKQLINKESDIHLVEKPLKKKRKLIKTDEAKIIIENQQIDASKNSKEKEIIKSSNGNMKEPEQPVKNVTVNYSKFENCMDNSNELYIISEFCAEKFRNTDLNRFVGSNISEIFGYAMPKNFKMEIHHFETDNENITKFWEQSYDISLTDKYEKYEKFNNKTINKNYIAKVKAARKANKKIPKLNLKRLKNKSIFSRI